MYKQGQLSLSTHLIGSSFSQGLDPDGAVGWLNGVSVFDIDSESDVGSRKTKRSNCIYWADSFGLKMFWGDRKSVVVKRENNVTEISKTGMMDESGEEESRNSNWSEWALLD